MRQDFWIAEVRKLRAAAIDHFLQSTLIKSFCFGWLRVPMGQQAWGAGRGGETQENPQRQTGLSLVLWKRRTGSKAKWPGNQNSGPVPDPPFTLPRPAASCTWLVQPLLVGKRSAILILPTLFKSVPINTTKDQNTLHFQGAKPTRWAFRQTQQGPSGEGEQANPCSSTGSLLHSNPA